MQIVKNGIYSSRINDFMYMVLDIDDSNNITFLRFRAKSCKNSEIQKEILEILKNKKINVFDFTWDTEKGFENDVDGYLGQFNNGQIEEKYLKKLLKKVDKKQTREDIKESLPEWYIEHFPILISIVIALTIVCSLIPLLF